MVITIDLIFIYLNRFFFNLRSRKLKQTITFLLSTPMIIYDMKIQQFFRIYCFTIVSRFLHDYQKQKINQQAVTNKFYFIPKKYFLTCTNIK